jgi:hypothetical protein
MNPVNAQIAAHPVISEVYGGGGNSGAYYTNDFVELYNPTASAVTITGWSIQYQSATNTGSTWQRTFISGTILPHRFYLVQEAQGSAGTGPLPAPDAVGTIPLGSTGGKVALVSDTASISGPSGPHVVDFLGYGTANQFEGTSAAGPLSNTTSAERKAQAGSTAASMSEGGIDSLAGNGWDSGENHADFVIVPTQGPQSSSSSPEMPPATGNLPPVISNARRTQLVAEPGGTDTVTADIADPDGSISSARLSVRVDGGAFDSSIAMAPVSGSLYRGVIPAGRNAPAGSLVEYFVSALDDSFKYVSTRASLGGYFIGDAPVSSIKSHPLSEIASYGARVSGTLNVATNTFSNGEGFIQDSTGGISIGLAGGLPQFRAGRRLEVEGSVGSSGGAYRIGAPGFSFKDTSLGSSALTPDTLTLPVVESADNLNDGRLVVMPGISTSSTGTFTSGKSYLFRDAASDTITVRAESYAGLNTLPGTPIPESSVDAAGILSFSAGFCRLLPRSAYDMGNTPVVTYEAVASGSWGDTSTWSGRSVPGDSSDVTFSTPGVTVTVDLPDARCRNLTMTGSGTSLGPTLRFGAAGAPQLDVKGNLAISGGSGGGQGGRSKLTSDGNASCVLILRGGIFTTSSNSSANGNSGLNMNEGFVKLQGNSTDTLRNSAGLRLGNLQIGDGIDSKTTVWNASKKTTLVVRSLLVKSRASFLIGDAADTNSSDIGNASASGLPMLTGGITVEPGARLLVRPSSVSGAHGEINLDAGGITNDGAIELFASPSSKQIQGADTSGSPSSYSVRIGGLPAGSSSSYQTIGGSRRCVLADVSVAEGHSLRVLKSPEIAAPYTLTLRGTLSEIQGEPVAGRIEAARRVGTSVPENFGGIGCVIAARGQSPESTVVARVTGVPSGPSILRYYDITPAVNTGLDATLDFSYDNSELNGQDARTLRLWRSGTEGATWMAPAGSSVDTSSHTVHLGGIDSFSRWTLSDAAHVLENASMQMEYALSRNWNLVSVPLRVPDPRRAALFPGSAFPAFSYDGAYVVSDTLHPGTGYWLRTPAAETVTIEGVPSSADTVRVTDGWNLIGSSAFPVSASQVIQVPSGIVVSNYFDYNNGYAASGILDPGKGYWVKISGGGLLIFRP